MTRLYALQADAWMGLAGQAVGAEEPRRGTAWVGRADVCVERALERKCHAVSAAEATTASLSNAWWPLDRSCHPHVFAVRAHEKRRG